VLDYKISINALRVLSTCLSCMFPSSVGLRAHLLAPLRVSLRVPLRAPPSRFPAVYPQLFKSVAFCSTTSATCISLCPRNCSCLCICLLHFPFCLSIKFLVPFYWLSFGSLRHNLVGRDSSAGIATRYGLYGPGIEYRWGRYFPYSSRPTLGPNHPPIQWGPGLSGGKAAGACR
jgi:hypothetical protein